MAVDVYRFVPKSLNFPQMLTSDERVIAALMTVSLVFWTVQYCLRWFDGQATMTVAVRPFPSASASTHIL